MLGERSYSGPPLDLREQYITERPELDDDVDEDSEDTFQNELEDDQDDVDAVTIYATDPEPPGRERTENVPIPGSEPEQSPWIDPEDTEQSSLDDWGAR